MIIYIDRESNKKNDPRKTEEYKKYAFAFIRRQKVCEICGSKINLQLHHVQSVWVHPELVIEDSNCMCLCSGARKFDGCHKRFGHLGNFNIYNPTVKSMKKY